MAVDGQQVPTGPRFSVGQPVAYYRTQRGGYGFVTKVPSTVVRVGPKKVMVAFFTKSGGEVTRWVDPKNLEPYDYARDEGFIRG